MFQVYGTGLRFLYICYVRMAQKMNSSWAFDDLNFEKGIAPVNELIG